MQPGAAWGDERQSRGALFAHGRSADAGFRLNLLLEQTRQAKETAQATALARAAAICGHLWPLRGQAKAAALELCAQGVPPVVVLDDGAGWIKKEQGKHFPEATCILDWARLWC